MVTVVGGTYLEKCREPGWDELYGSGLRAARFLAENGVAVALHTFVGSTERPTLNYLCGDFGVTANVTEIPFTVGFYYGHTLAVPETAPNRHQIEQFKPRAQINVAADNVLAFGFIEGTSTVTGMKVVYDPQSPSSPSSFRKQGNKAEILAIVANSAEIRLLGNSEDISTAAKNTMAAENAAIVIVKRGPAGCIVLTRHGERSVPAFRTNSVFSIGSGDVFSAAFAYRWIECGEDPVDAAYYASKSAAYYCERRIMPKAEDLARWNPAELPAPSGVQRKVYLAGPFFTAGERWLIEEVRNSLLQFGVAVFSPLHDVGPGAAEMVWGPDIAGLEECPIVLACLDGMDPGTIYEIGYAHALKKDVIILVGNAKEEQLKMPVGGGAKVISDLPTAIYITAWAANH